MKKMRTVAGDGVRNTSDAVRILNRQSVEDDINVSGDTGDNSNKDENLGSLSELNLSFGGTLYLHPNDIGGSRIVTIKLTRAENYNPDLFAGAMYAKAAFKMWNDLKETYDKVYGSVVFNLTKSINSLNQNGSTLAKYYNNLNSLWKQFDVIINLPPCTLVSGEESHRNATFVGATKPATTAFATKTFDNKRRHVSSNNAFDDVLSNNATTDTRTNNSHVSLYNEHLSRLMGCLNDNDVSYANANIAANQHMIISTKKLINVMDISNLGLTVGHPNGTQALITEIGDLKINNDITLYGVLAIPEYTVSLLYVHKIARDSSCLLGLMRPNVISVI
ncbi:ribonuclease H-like domain-containing protein [Tanacetum coccineum]